MSTRLVKRTIGILQNMSDAEEELRVTQIAQMCNLSAATTHRLLQTLLEEGWVHQNSETGRYYLGMKLLQIGRRATQSVEVRSMALPVIEEIHKQTSECTYLNIIDGNQRLCVDSLEIVKDRRLTIIPPGQRSPLHAGASARCLLAFLERPAQDRYLQGAGLSRVTRRTVINPAQVRRGIENIRQQGYATSHSERVEGLWAAAVPLRDQAGKVVASVGVSFPETRYSTRLMRDIVKLLCQEANRFSTQSRRVAPHLQLHQP